MTLALRSMMKWWRIAVLLICLAFTAALLWYDYHGNGRHNALLTVFLILLLSGLVTTGIVPMPPGINIPFINLWPRLSDALKAVISLALIFLWTPIGMRLTPDTPVGVAILLGPDAVFLVAALVYLSNGLSRNLK